MVSPGKRNILNVLCALVLILFLGVTFIQSARRAVQRITGDFFFPFLHYPVKGQRELSNKALLLESRKSLAGALEQTEKLNLRLAAELSAYSSLGEENAELRRLLQLKKRVEFEFHFAEIILRDPTAWKERFTIDKGGDAGIRPGDVVVSGIVHEDIVELAVVGRISAVTRHTAEVNTLMNSSCRVSISIPDNNGRGILNGGFGSDGDFFVRGIYLPRDFDYRPGMRVLTSGLSRTTPAGLYVGKIAERGGSIRNYKNLYKEVDIELGADLNQIRFVMVISGD